MYADVIVIGGGIMSASFVSILHELEPNLKIIVFERLAMLAAESTSAWNNAGTGHAGYCELNYTKENSDGSIDISKAIKVCQQFEQSKSYWSYLNRKYRLIHEQKFMHEVPHISFVWGEENIEFLEKRVNTMKEHDFFREMIFTKDRKQMESWMPLVMQDRTHAIPFAASFMQKGKDVNYGQISHAIFDVLKTKNEIQILLNHEIRGIQKKQDNWEVEIYDYENVKTFTAKANYVFVGAGGGALDILDKSEIDEADGYGGFPISGLWLRCSNDLVINQHNAKVYGKANIGTPPMSVPHLDTRYINGKKELLFGPFAGFSTKFLKEGSYLDLPASIDFDNIIPMISAGWHNMELTKYLIEQLRLTQEERIMILRDYYPNAIGLDWELLKAGQRVQIIKKDKDGGGILEFGTEVIASHDRSIAAVLGASPGASVAVSIILEVIQKMMPDKINSTEWVSKLVQMGIY